MVAELVKVTLDMAGRQAGRAVGEQRVNVIPGQQGTVEAAGHRVVVGIFGEQLRHTGDDPRLRFQHADAVLGILEVVDIRGVVLRTAGRSGYQVGKLTGEGYLRRRGTMQQRQLVQHSRQPLALGLPVDVQAPQRVLQRLRTHHHLGGERLFAEVLQRTANLEVLRELILPVKAEHAFPLHTILGIALQGHVDGRSCIDDALVENGHLAGRIVDTII